MATTEISEEIPATAVSDAPRRRLRVDVATLLGFAAALGLLAAGLVVGGSIRAYFDLPSLLIVLGGTYGLTMACYSLDEILAAQRAVLKTLISSIPDPREAALYMVKAAETARRSGVLALETAANDVQHLPFARKAIALVVDGAVGEDVAHVLKSEIDEMVARHRTSVAVLRRAADIAPAMGLIGTLIGLVQMLGRLDDPAAIGPAMALALITTFYGALLSTMLFTPLATKLERNSADEALVCTIYQLGATSIGKRESPRRLELVLDALLPPAKRFGRSI